jgi:hypothetical protein
MTTQALRELRDKVAAGMWPSDFLAIDSGGPLRVVTTATLYKAFSGSLDAAKELHETALPGWRWFLDCNGRAYVWRRFGDTRPRIAYSAHNPARAWLLAILDALIQGDKADG